MGAGWMKEYFSKLLKTRLFIIALNIVFGYLAFSAVVIATLDTPREAFEQSNLPEVLKVFEDYD